MCVVHISIMRAWLATFDLVCMFCEDLSLVEVRLNGAFLASLGAGGCLSLPTTGLPFASALISWMLFLIEVFGSMSIGFRSTISQ